MKTLAFPIDWRESPNGLVPVDNHLYSLTLDFCKAELAEMPDLTLYRKVWVSAVVDKDDKPTRVTGLQAAMQVVDSPICRYTDSKSALLLSSRLDSWMADQGLRGAPVFIYLSSNEKPEQRCKGFADWLRFWKAKPADRWIVRVR